MARNDLLWNLAARLRSWSYRLEEAADELERRADPPKLWVPKSEFDRTFHDVLLKYYSDIHESPVFLIDKLDRAERLETIKGTYRYRPASYCVKEEPQGD